MYHYQIIINLLLLSHYHISIIVTYYTSSFYVYIS